MKPTIGRIVIFHVDDVTRKFSGNDCNGVYELPALITRVWSDTCVNLQIFNDGPSYSNDDCRHLLWVTSVVEGKGPRNWSWPERN